MHKNEQRQDWDTDMLYISMYQQGYVDVHSMSVSQSCLTWSTSVFSTHDKTIKVGKIHRYVKLLKP